VQILMYHSISEAASPMSLSPAAFSRQMAWLRQNGWQSLTLRTAMETDRPPRRAVVLTFDDGFADAYLTAWPILREHGMTATVFLVTDQVGQVASWPEARPVAPLLDWGQIKEMASAGIEFGSHTATHLDVRTASDDEIYRELVQSKATLEEQLGEEVVSFAYPYGYFRTVLPELLREAGYRYAVLAGGYRDNRGCLDAMRLSRTPVWGRDSLFTFQAKVRGWLAYRHYTEKAAVEVRWQCKELRRRWGRGR